MKDQLVVIKTAELAKEKGFDINTYSNCWLKTLDGEIIHNSERKNIFEHDRCEPFLMQPTQVQLQKWLREKHDIDITINRSWTMNRSYYYCILQELTFDNILQQESTPDRSYEQSLEDALQESLKLI